MTRRIYIIYLKLKLGVVRARLAVYRWQIRTFGAGS